MPKHKSILSSLNALGASELPVTTNSVPRNSVLASVAAAGVSLLACPSAEAGTIDFFTPNVNVGVAGGDINNFNLNIASLPGGLKLTVVDLANTHGIFFDNSHVSFRWSTPQVPGPAAYGQKFSQIGVGSSSGRIAVAVGSAGVVSHGTDFSQEYYAFSFTDASSQTHYGWTYGTLSGGYSNLISYGYDTTPGVKITTGQTQDTSPTPEPSTTALGAMAALILGAAGVRKWNQSRA